MGSSGRDNTARARIRDYLLQRGPIIDSSGRATALLKDAIGYKGSSVAFIQLVAAMSKEGEIVREIRGKRTYKISGVGSAGAPVEDPNALVSAYGSTTAAIDYDSLARALLRQLATQYAAAGTPASDVEALRTERDLLIAERDAYALRLQLARRQLSALTGSDVDGHSLPDEVVPQAKALLAQLAREWGVVSDEQAV